MKYIIHSHAILAIAAVTFVNVDLAQDDADQCLKAFAFEFAIPC